jgi:hypothetical protein
VGLKCPLPLSEGGSQSPTGSPPGTRRTMKEATAKRRAVPDLDPIAADSVATAAACGSGSGMDASTGKQAKKVRRGPAESVRFPRGSSDAENIGPSFLLGPSVHGHRDGDTWAEA